MFAIYIKLIDNALQYGVIVYAAIALSVGIDEIANVFNETTPVELIFLDLYIPISSSSNSIDNSRFDKAMGVLCQSRLGRLWCQIPIPPLDAEAWGILPFGKVSAVNSRNTA